MNADTAVSGAQAIEKTAANDYDIIFMDYRMLEMDGIEAAAHGCLSKPIIKHELEEILRQYCSSLFN